MRVFRKCFCFVKRKQTNAVCNLCSHPGRCIRLLCEKYGEKKIAPNGGEYYDFPTPKVLSQVSVEELYACNLGYRSSKRKYIAEVPPHNHHIFQTEIHLDIVLQVLYWYACLSEMLLVWSWLRMNAGGVLNTCKSNGLVLKPSDIWVSGGRVSNAWVTCLETVYWCLSISRQLV